MNSKEFLDCSTEGKYQTFKYDNRVKGLWINSRFEKGLMDTSFIAKGDIQRLVDYLRSQGLTIS